MIETQAEVLRVEPGYAWVRIRPHTPCGNCDPETGCKSIAMTRMFSLRGQEFRVSDPLGSASGDLVRVAVEEGTLLNSALWGYGLPLMLLLLGAFTGFSLAPSTSTNVATFLGALAGVVLAFFLARRYVQDRIPEIIEKRAPGLLQISECNNTQ